MSNRLLIRPAKEEDAGAIFTLMKEFAAYVDLTEYFEATEASIVKTLFEKKMANVLIAENDGFPVGYAIYYETFASFQAMPGLFIEDLFITPPFRGKGYGTELVKTIMRLCEEEGYHRVEWRCLAWNRKAQEFYKKLGASLQDHCVTFRMYIGDREYMSV